MSPFETTVHLRCSHTGTWRVETGDADPVTVSEHPSETAAEQAALEHFSGIRGQIIVHDRYDRIRSTALPADPR